MTRELPRTERASRRFPLPSSLYSVFFIVLNLAAVGAALFDPKGIAVLFVTVAYTLHVRLLLTTREEARRAHDLLEELLDAASPLGKSR